MTEFDRHKVHARKDLLHFVEETLDRNVYRKLGDMPTHWIEELETIHRMLTGEGMVGGTNIFRPPVGDKEFRRLGRGVYLYRTGDRRLRGLWTSRKIKGYDFKTSKEVPEVEWTHYDIGTRAVLFINQEFKDIPVEALLPENFEHKGSVIKSDKRPIRRFTIDGKDIVVYAKGCALNPSFYTEQPVNRLTTLAGVDKVSSKAELERLEELQREGVSVPAVIGHYECPLEEYLFLREVQGKTPNEYFGTHRGAIIQQDAKMLAALCLLGYRKVGFCDFDDKVFDGSRLYLIDVDELEDLYRIANPNFREILLNPTSQQQLDKFRKDQTGLFRTMLKDALYHYRETLTPKRGDMTAYIRTFFERVGWKQPSQDEEKSLTTFPSDYTTLDAYLSMMSDTG